MVTRRQPTTRRKRPAKPASAAEQGTPWEFWERIIAIGAAVPEAEWAKGPHDSARYCDEYLEGARKER